MPLAKLVEAGFTPEEAATVTAMKGTGCDRCNGSGYKGRVGLFEVMEMSASGCARLIIANAPVTNSARRAIEDGMVTLRQSGLQKVREGVTTLEEVVRETM